MDPGVGPWYESNRMLIQHNHDDVREWHIWAAKNHWCPKCGAPPHEPCLNLTDAKKGTYPRRNRWPHPERVDWNQLESYLCNVLGYR